MARPLDFQMPVEDEVLRELRKILQQASEEIASELAKESSEKVGEAVSRAQAEAILRATKAHLQGDWRSIGDALSQSRKLAAMAAVEGFYDQMSGPLSTLLGSDGKESFVRAQAAAAATRIDTVVARLTESKRSLSQQVWQTRALSNRWLDSKINQALARGWDAQRLAREVVQFVDPNVPGGASYAAMRLARTEINNAFHAQTLQSMADSGVVEYVKWNLSRSHPDKDICDDLADHRIGEPIPGKESEEREPRDVFRSTGKSYEAWDGDSPTDELFTTPEYNRNSKEVDAAEFYREEGYQEVNRYLRDPSGYEAYMPKSYVRRMQEVAESLDRLTQSGHTNRDMMVFRGQGHDSFFRAMGLESDGAEDFDVKSLIGRVWTQDSFLSTSIVKTEDLPSTGEFGDKSLQLRINLPNGTRGYWYGDGEDNYEKEFLLHRGSQFVITDARVEGEGSDTKWWIDVLLTGD